MSYLTLLRKLIVADLEWDKVNPGIEPRFHLRLWVEVTAKADDRANNQKVATPFDWRASDEEYVTAAAAAQPATLDRYDEAETQPNFEAETQPETQQDRYDMAETQPETQQDRYDEAETQAATSEPIFIEE